LHLSILAGHYYPLTFNFPQEPQTCQVQGLLWLFPANLQRDDNVNAYNVTITLMLITWTYWHLFLLQTEVP